MSGRTERKRHLDRRRVLAGLAASAVATRARAQEDPLQQLIQENQRSDMGQGFDAASRTIAMPKASLPTLSPATAQTTEAALTRYEQIVAGGGWPEVPANDRLQNELHPVSAFVVVPLFGLANAGVTLDSETLHSALPFASYDGVTLTGFPVTTISRGEVIVADGAFVGAAGRGSFVERGF